MSLESWISQSNRLEIKSLALYLKELYNSKDPENLKTLLSYFKIPFVEGQLPDYIIEEPVIENGEINIKVENKKANILWDSLVSSNSKTLGWAGANYNQKFIHVKTITPKSVRTVIYDSQKDMPKAEIIEITNGEYTITFKRTAPGVVQLIWLQDGTRLAFEYKKNDKNLMQTIYKHDCNHDKIKELNQLMIGYQNVEANYYLLDMEDALISGVKHKGLKFCLNGGCFERVSRNALDYVLNDFTYTYPIINIDDINNITSALVFHFYDNSNLTFNKLEIFKKDANFNISCQIIDIKDNQTIYNDNFVLSSLNEGNITAEEVAILLSRIQPKYSAKPHFNFIMEQIVTFQESLKLKKINEHITLEISPQRFAHQSFTEISSYIEEHREHYFEAMAQEYQKFVNNCEKGQSRILKKDN